jgi:F0F1-type ATP synthase membrane subunit b/b'
MRSKARALVRAAGASPRVARQYLQQLKNEIAKATEVMNKEIAYAAAELKAQAGKAHDHCDREVFEHASHFLTQVGKARLITETLGL